MAPRLVPQGTEMAINRRLWHQGWCHRRHNFIFLSYNTKKTTRGYLVVILKGPVLRQAQQPGKGSATGRWLRDRSNRRAGRLVLAPDHLIDDAGVGLDDLDDLGGDILVGVNRHRDAMISSFVHLDSGVNRLQ